MSESTRGFVAATTRAVEVSIRELRRRRIHRHFPGYLCTLRAATAAGSRHNIRVNFKQFFDDFMAYGNAPVRRPYVMPFSTSDTTSSIFFNRNVAGSYAPSSIRPGYPFAQVVSVVGRNADARYTLSDEHASVAFKCLLYGQKLPIVSLSIFLYRDYGIEVKDQAMDNHNVFVEEFRSESGFAASGDGEANFAKLFEMDASYLQGLPITQRVDVGGAR